MHDQMCMEHDPPWMIVVNLVGFNVMVDAHCHKRFQDAIKVLEYGREGVAEM